MTTTQQPQPGDIRIVPTDDGKWGPRLTFLHPEPENPTAMGIFQDAAGETVRYFFKDLINPVGSAIADQSAPPKRRRKGPSNPLTAEQRGMIFTLGKGRGMSTDDIRELTPAGSISALSTRQASQLIDALRGKRVDLTAPTGPDAKPTDQQIAMLYCLAEDAGMDRRHLQNFMRQKFKVSGPSDPQLTNAKIQKVFGALRNIARQRGASDPNRARKEVALHS